MGENYFDEFCGRIKNKKLVNSIHTIKEAASVIWTKDVRIIRDYTDHGPDHSERIFEKLYNLLWPDNGIASLTDEELYILVLGVILHDIGMQCDIKRHTQIKDKAIAKFGAKFDLDFAPGTANTYSKEEQVELRNNHHLLTAAWLDCCFKDNVVFPNNALQSVNKRYRRDLIDVCRFHSKLNMKDCPTESKVSHLRCQFLAALLRLGDELDIDANRADVQTVQVFGVNPDSRIFWYIHDHTTIDIKDHVIYIRIYLAREDYLACSAILQENVIDKFITKNQEFIEILIKNHVRVAISTDSSVEEDEYQDILPEEIREQIVNIGKPAAENDKPQPTDSNREKAFAERLTKLRATINHLYEDNAIEKAKLKKLQELFNELHYHRELRTSLRDEDISVAKKAYSFIQGLGNREMAFLVDIGIGLHAQVLEGISQREAQQLFEKISGDSFLKTPLTSDYWDYSFEQVRRILDDYASINSFDFDSVGLSEGYVHKETAGQLLAVSVCGEVSQVYVWNLDRGTLTPVAALGGLYEEVYDLQILRDKGFVYIAAKGLGRMYVWNLTLKKSQPIRVFENNTICINKFTVVRSVNGGLYVLGITQHGIFLWDFYKAGDPVKLIKNECDMYDVFIVDSRLAPSGASYALIGHSSYASNINNVIWEIKEESALNFSVTPLFDKKAIIGTMLDPDSPDYTINEYQILPGHKVLGALTPYALILYDIDRGKQIGHILHEGQQPFRFDMIEINGQIHMLISYLWIERKDDGKGLIRCFSIENGMATEAMHLFRNQHDMGQSVITLHKNKIKIFFYEHLQGTVYEAEYNQKDYHEFYKFPNTMRVVDMICG